MFRSNFSLSSFIIALRDIFLKNNLFWLGNIFSKSTRNIQELIKKLKSCPIKRQFAYHLILFERAEKFFIDFLKQPFPRLWREMAVGCRSKPMFDPAGIQSVREIHEKLHRDLANPRTSNPSAPFSHPAHRANPSICPQFLLAAKPQTYKGGSPAGSESAAHGFDSAMRAAISRTRSSVISHPFQNAAACFPETLVSLYVYACIQKIYVYIENICRYMYRCSGSGSDFG